MGHSLRLAWVDQYVNRKPFSGKSHDTVSSVATSLNMKRDLQHSHVLVNPVTMLIYKINVNE